MNVKIMTKNFASNEGVEELVKKELLRVEPMFASNTRYDVCIKKEKNKANKTVFKCDITIKNGKKFVRGYAEMDTVVSAVDFAVDSLKRKARKIKTLEKKKRKEYNKFLSVSYDECEQEEQEAAFSFELNRVKNIEADVLPVEDAAIQMEMSGHNFFVFKDENGNVNVIYKKEKGYGLIVVE